MSTQHTPPGLYIVATPIGNLGDITLRALEVLKLVDLIICEDTRVTAKLLQHYGIEKPTLSYNDHNAAARRPQILQALEHGQRVALVSDAGTPLISDPGYKLAREVLDRGLYVTTLPGASSVLSALCLSGLPTDRFFFAGFLPHKSEARRAALQEVSTVAATLIFFESANRLEDSLADMVQLLGHRDAAVVREISKLYEESRRDSLPALLAHYTEHGAPKGEVVIVVGAPMAEPMDDSTIESHLRLLLATHGVKEAASIVAEESGRARKEIYSLALELIKRDAR
ncbi:MAG: 16S rRNA (cytidine(1402)-2'-O)-methyltransferase [Rickettsiales bacterium]|nr:16S rRNA (cytidine(1402)-2'-O)-methyltransferase [Rickettsiales bacterium]